MEILAILFSPIIAVLVSIYISNRLEKRKDRIEIFKTLMTTRENPSTIEFVKAVNSIDVIFSDRSEVRGAWRSLYETYSKGEVDLVQKKHTKLLETMANDLGYKDKITWEDITSSYTPNWLLNDRLNQTKFKNYQLQAMSQMLGANTKNAEETIEKKKA